MVNGDAMRRCRECGQDKPLTQFTADGRDHRNTCRDCLSPAYLQRKERESIATFNRMVACARWPTL